MIDFNNASSQSSFDLIPANLIAKARLVIRPGNDSIDPLITNSKSSNTAYLDCSFIILEGPYAKRKIFDRIGLSGSDRWVNMGKARIRAILESAHGIHPKDVTEVAMNARKINSFSELNNLDLVIKIGIEHDRSGMYQDKNRVASIITPEHIAYTEYMTGQDIPWGM